jgi:cyclophilin family peptidyl-prolyl cis-trans isomerase
MPPRRARRPEFDALDDRQLLATLLPIGDVSVPATLGFQMPVFGGTDPQTYTVTSSNPGVPVTVAQGKFLTITVTHASSGANDPSFTGAITFQLFDDLTPMTTSKIEQLVNQGFYTNKNFHRIANNFPGPNDFIVQGGSVNGDGTGNVNQPGFPFGDEFNTQLAFTGVGQLAMANAGPNTNSSQFFVTTGTPTFLDFKHTIFGQLVAGQNTLQAMTKVALGGTGGTTPLSPILIQSATLSNTNPSGVLHINTTQSQPGQTSTITVTATDSVNHTTATRTFQVNVVPDLVNGQPNTPRPFLQPIANQVVGLVQTSPTIQGQTAVFKVQGVDAVATDPLTYAVGGGANSTNTGFTPVQNATVTTDGNGVITVVPNAGFTGVINLLVGVRDNTDRSGTGNINDFSNFDTQPLTLTVNNTAPVNLAPIATPGSATVVTNTPTQITLQGMTANPQSTTQTLSFSLLSQPTNGTLSGFNPQTGTVTYTPNNNFQGTDSFTFNVTDVGAPTPNLTSGPATFTLSVGGGVATGTVRQIGRVLVVTPLPKDAKNTTPDNISVTLQSGKVVTTVNGIVDSLQPNETDLDRLVVFGSKSSTLISISPDLTLPATLDGGHGGTNFVQAGSGESVLHGWFGQNTLSGGVANDTLIGRTGHVRFVRSGGVDVLFAGNPHARATLRKTGTRPSGTFYQFIGNRLVPVIPGSKAATTSPTAGSATSTTSTDSVRQPRVVVRNQPARNHGAGQTG